MSKVNLGAMAQALLKAGLPGKVPDSAHVDRAPVAIVDRGPLPAWELPAEGVVTASKAKAEAWVRVCDRCGEKFEVTLQGDALPTTCSLCSRIP